MAEFVSGGAPNVTAGAPIAMSALGTKALIKVLSTQLRFSEFFMSKKEEMEGEIFESWGSLRSSLRSKKLTTDEH